MDSATNSPTCNTDYPLHRHSSQHERRGRPPAGLTSPGTESVPDEFAHNGSQNCFCWAHSSNFGPIRSRKGDRDKSRAKFGDGAKSIFAWSATKQQVRSPRGPSPPKHSVISLTFCCRRDGTRYVCVCVGGGGKLHSALPCSRRAHHPHHFSFQPPFTLPRFVLPTYLFRASPTAANTADLSTFAFGPSVSLGDSVLNGVCLHKVDGDSKGGKTDDITLEACNWTVRKANQSDTHKIKLLF